MPKSFLISRKKRGEFSETDILKEPPMELISISQSKGDQNSLVYPITAISDNGKYQGKDNIDFHCKIVNSELTPSHLHLPDHSDPLPNISSHLLLCHPAVQGFTTDSMVVDKMSKHVADSLLGYDNTKFPVIGQESSDTFTKASGQLVQRSLSSIGQIDDSYSESTKSNIYTDLNNNHNEIYRIPTRFENKLTKFFDSGFTNHLGIFTGTDDHNINIRPSSRESVQDASGTSVQHPSSTNFLAQKCPKLADRSSSSYSPFEPPNCQQQFRDQESKMQINSPLSRVQREDSCNSWMSNQVTSVDARRSLETLSILSKFTPFSPEGGNESKLSCLNYTNGTAKWAAAIVPRNTPEVHDKIDTETLSTHMTSHSVHLKTSPRVPVDKMAPSYLTQSKGTARNATDELQLLQGVSDSKVERQERHALCPVSPHSPVSNSSSPSSVKSSSLLKHEPWVSQSDLLSSPPASSTLLSFSSSPSSVSPGIAPSTSVKQPSGPPIRSLFFRDCPRSQTNPTNRSGSREGVDSETAGDIMPSVCERVDCHSIPPCSEHSQNNDGPTTCPNFDIPRDGNTRNEIPIPLIGTKRKMSSVCFDDTSERKSKELKNNRKSFTIESIMSRDSHSNGVERIEEKSVESAKSISMQSSEKPIFKHETCKSDKTLTIHTSTENRQSPLNFNTNDNVHSQCSRNDKRKVDKLSEARNQAIATNNQQCDLNIATKQNSTHFRLPVSPTENERLDLKRNRITSNSSARKLSSFVDLERHESDSRTNLSQSQTKPASSSSTVHKLHRPLPLLPRPPPIFPSFLAYSPTVPVEHFPPSPFLPSPHFQGELQVPSRIPDLPINDCVSSPFVNNILTFITDNKLQQGAIDARSLKQHQQMHLMRLNEKNANMANSSTSITSNTNINYYNNGKDVQVYNDRVYIPNEAVKYAQHCEMANSGTHPLQPSPYLATKAFGTFSRKRSSESTTSGDMLSGSFTDVAIPVNRMITNQSVAPIPPRCRSRLDSAGEAEMDMQQVSPGVMSPLKALGISSGGKSFKGFLESANVKLEFINKGHGIKNPLLNADFGEAKLNLLSHTGNVPCPVCHATFQSSRELQRHLKSHKEIKRFLCTFCGKGFNDTFDLKRHTRTHTGVRPYKCPQCDKSFTQRCSLESHCRKIHGVSPQMAFNQRRAKLYVCEDCGHATSIADEHFAHLRHTHARSVEDKGDNLD